MSIIKLLVFQENQGGSFLVNSPGLPIAQSSEILQMGSFYDIDLHPGLVTVLTEILSEDGPLPGGYVIIVLTISNGLSCN